MLNNDHRADKTINVFVQNFFCNGQLPFLRYRNVKIVNFAKAFVKKMLIDLWANCYSNYTISERKIQSLFRTFLL